MFKEFFILFLTKRWDAIRGISIWRIGQIEILINFRDSSLSLLYIIVVSRFVEIFLFRDFITMQIEYIDRYIF